MPYSGGHALIEAKLSRCDTAQRPGEDAIYNLLQGVLSQSYRAHGAILFVPARANPEQLPDDRYGLSRGSRFTPIGAQFEARRANDW